jgi:hypothetical protein
LRKKYKGKGFAINKSRERGVNTPMNTVGFGVINKKRRLLFIAG